MGAGNWRAPTAAPRLEEKELLERARQHQGQALFDQDAKAAGLVVGVALEEGDVALLARFRGEAEDRRIPFYIAGALPRADRNALVSSPDPISGAFLLGVGEHPRYLCGTKEQVRKWAAKALKRAEQEEQRRQRQDIGDLTLVAEVLMPARGISRSEYPAAAEALGNLLELLVSDAVEELLGPEAPVETHRFDPVSIRGLRRGYRIGLRSSIRCSRETADEAVGALDAVAQHLRWLLTRVEPDMRVPASSWRNTLPDLGLERISGGRLTLKVEDERAKDQPASVEYEERLRLR